jgi:hypothetical protein
MQSENSCETFNLSDSEQETNVSQEIFQRKQQNIVIFDWDNTLFCTDYLAGLKVDFKQLFSEEKSLEEFGFYLIHELQQLEQVSVIYL